MNLYIIGNGFDLDLGLQTSYNSFIQSEDFKKFNNVHISYGLLIIGVAESNTNFVLLAFINNS